MKKHWYTLKSPAHVACGIISKNGVIRLQDVTCKRCINTKRAKELS